jgi:hypothetical protein
MELCLDGDCVLDNAKLRSRIRDFFDAALEKARDYRAIAVGGRLGEVRDRFLSFIASDGVALPLAEDIARDLGRLMRFVFFAWDEQSWKARLFEEGPLQPERCSACVKGPLGTQAVFTQCNANRVPGCHFCAAHDGRRRQLYGVWDRESLVCSLETSIDPTQRARYDAGVEVAKLRAVRHRGVPVPRRPELPEGRAADVFAEGDGEAWREFLFERGAVLQTCLACTWSPDEKRPLFRQCTNRREVGDFCRGVHGTAEKRRHGAWNVSSGCVEGLSSELLEDGERTARKRHAARPRGALFRKPLPPVGGAANVSPCFSSSLAAPAPGI